MCACVYVCMCVLCARACLNYYISLWRPFFSLSKSLPPWHNIVFYRGSLLPFDHQSALDTVPFSLRLHTTRADILEGKHAKARRSITPVLFYDSFVSVSKITQAGVCSYVYSCLR